MMKGRFASLTSRQSVINFTNTSWKLLETAIFESEEGEDDEDDDNDDDDDDEDEEEEEYRNSFLILQSKLVLIQALARSTLKGSEIIIFDLKPFDAEHN